MDARVDQLAMSVTHLWVPMRRAGGVGSSATPTDSRTTLEGWLHPGIPWTLLVGALAALVLLSLVLTTASWSGTRKNNDLRSLGRRGFHEG